MTKFPFSDIHGFCCLCWCGWVLIFLSDISRYLVCIALDITIDVLLQ